MTESFSKNFIDYEEYPQSAEIQNRCVNMIARLYNARKSWPSVGTIRDLMARGVCSNLKR